MTQFHQSVTRTASRNHRRTNLLVSTLVVCCPFFGPAGAFADNVTWNYGVYDKFEEAMAARESGPIVYTEDKAPLYVLTRFVIEGESADDWIEALEILNTNRKQEPKDVGMWYERFKAQGEETCPSEWRMLEQSKKALLFERLSHDCDPFEAQHAIYNVLYGKRDVFVFIATRKGEMATETRDGLLKLLRSVKISR